MILKLTWASWLLFSTIWIEINVTCWRDEAKAARQEVASVRVNDIDELGVGGVNSDNWIYRQESSG